MALPASFEHMAQQEQTRERKTVLQVLDPTSRSGRPRFGAGTPAAAATGRASAQDNSNSKRACFFDLAGETAIFTLSPSAVRKPNNRSNE
jgi:hypothetical protein